MYNTYLDDLALAEPKLERLAGKASVELFVVGLKPTRVVHSHHRTGLRLRPRPLLDKINKKNDGLAIVTRFLVCMNNFLNNIYKHTGLDVGENAKKGVFCVPCDKGGGFVATRVADPQQLTADTDSSFNINADPYSTFTLMRNPDPAPRQVIQAYRS
jgi:hypothetical protein